MPRHAPGWARATTSAVGEVGELEMGEHWRRKPIMSVRSLLTLASTEQAIASCWAGPGTFLR